MIQIDPKREQQKRLKILRQWGIEGRALDLFTEKLQAHKVDFLKHHRAEFDIIVKYRVELSKTNEWAQAYEQTVQQQLISYFKNSEIMEEVQRDLKLELHDYPILIQARKIMLNRLNRQWALI